MDDGLRILDDGATALSDCELLRVLLGQSARAQLACERVATRGAWSLRRAAGAELLGAGLHAGEAARVLAAVELGRRAAARKPEKRARLASPAKVAERLWDVLAHLPREEFWALLLSSQREELRAVRISVGGLSQCSVLPREAFAPALLHAAPAVVFAHNHPSGDPRPSPDDQRLALLLDEAGRALGVEVLDHLVLAEAGAHSARAGLLPALAPQHELPLSLAGATP